MKFISHSLADTEKFSEKFLKDLTSSKGRATAVGLYGDLGSGKTTFTQSVGRALGITDPMQSPTFVIIKTYNLPRRSPPPQTLRGKQPTTHNKKHTRLLHVDAYRLESGEELRRLGFEELLADPKNLILVEWANQVADILPADHIKLSCRFISETTREFFLESSRSRLEARR